MFYTSKKESWEKALERSDKEEQVEGIFSTLKWLKSKGCDKMFYISFSLHDLFLTKNCRVERTSDDKIVFRFTTIFNNEQVLIGLNKMIESDISFTETERKELLEMKQKSSREINRLIIEIKTETEHYSHITKINQYDEFEKILDEIIEEMI